jgi:hypothetical protein
MTDKEKLEKVVKLADAMYYAAQSLTTDASKLHNAMDEYHQFIITEYNKQEPASEDLEIFRTEYVDKEIERIYPNLSPHLPRKQKLHLTIFNGEDLEIAIDKATQWQKAQMMKDAVDGGCFSYKNGYLHISCDIDEHLTDIKIGDKVKVIIIK